MDVALFAAVLFIILAGMKCIKQRSLEGFTDQKIERDEHGVTIVKRPFVNIFDQKGRRLNVILISKPFSGDKEFALYEQYKKDNVIIGISSYLEFPNMVTNPFENFTKKLAKAGFTALKIQKTISQLGCLPYLPANRIGRTATFYVQILSRSRKNTISFIFV
jgi:hypothetical protein